MTIFWEKTGDSIQGRTLYKGGHYSRKYGIFENFICRSREIMDIFELNTSKFLYVVRSLCDH